MWDARLTALRFAIITALLLAVAALAAVSATGQPATAVDAEPAQSDSTRLVADFDEDLAITERHIETGRLDAGARVGFGDASDPIEVTVGASVGADTATIVLRNVFGHVRFHASLARIINVIESHRPSIR